MFGCLSSANNTNKIIILILIGQKDSEQPADNNIEAYLTIDKSNSSVFSTTTARHCDTRS